MAEYNWWEPTDTEANIVIDCTEATQKLRISPLNQPWLVQTSPQEWSKTLQDVRSLSSTDQTYAAWNLASTFVRPRLTLYEQADCLLMAAALWQVKTESM